VLYRDLMDINIVDIQAAVGQNPNQLPMWKLFVYKWQEVGLTQFELIEIKDLYYKWREE
jgi:hypothetical protein